MYVYIYKCIFIYINTLTRWMQMLESWVCACLLVAICRCDVWMYEAMLAYRDESMRALSVIWEMHRFCQLLGFEVSPKWVFPEIQKVHWESCPSCEFHMVLKPPFFLPPGETRLQCFCRVQGWSLVAIYLKSSIPAVFNVEVYYHPLHIHKDINSTPEVTNLLKTIEVLVFGSVLRLWFIPTHRASFGSMSTTAAIWPLQSKFTGVNTTLDCKALFHGCSNPYANAWFHATVC